MQFLQLILVFPWGYSLPHMRSFGKSRAGSPRGAWMCPQHIYYHFAQSVTQRGSCVLDRALLVYTSTCVFFPRWLLILIQLWTYLRQSINSTAHGWVQNLKWNILLGWDLKKPCDLLHFIPHVYVRVEFKHFSRHTLTKPQYYQTETSWISKYFHTRCHLWTLRPILEMRPVS